ncbi:ribose 5-phosphate isomerase [Anopheles sinensis]|uniref:Ribose 5-phosphate isomerase n=1 Tax=Anopheles sinensis TaxID=74873 RepID=A0A084VG99_ANOSI|nr:ribose 5-phosphate isomerase [Anopheles sinensis]
MIKRRRLSDSERQFPFLEHLSGHPLPSTIPPLAIPEIGRKVKRYSAFPAEKCFKTRKATDVGSVVLIDDTINFSHDVWHTHVHSADEQRAIVAGGVSLTDTE